MKAVSWKAVSLTVRGHWLRRSLLLLPLGLLTGCSLLAQVGVPFVSQIEDIQAHPRVNWTVYLEGTVGDRVPLIAQQVYQLQDDTGSIWVLSNHTDIQTGDQVKIRGQVRFESIPIAGQEFGEVYIEEREQLGN